MEVKRTEIPDVFIVCPNVFTDDRGYFLETYNQDKYRELGITNLFVQDNESYSKQGVIRGLHLQIPPFSQGKLVRVVRGSVLDVAVDCRPQSKTFGSHVSVVLSEENKYQLWVPRGFAHGYSTLSTSVSFCYKCDNSYSPDHEIGIKHNDDILRIDWQVEDPIVSEKDKSNLAFSEVRKMLKSCRF